MKNRTFILGLIVVFFIACNSKEKAVDNEKNKTDSITRVQNKATLNSKIEKTIDLAYGFKANIGQSEDFKTFKTYSFFELKHFDKVIYTDTLLEYEFGHKLYPIVLQTGENKYELLFEINDRPTKNYLKRIIVLNEKIIKMDKLPTFISKAHDLDGDGIKEYAGFWDYSQVWGEKNDITAYNPILYYKVVPAGLKLDSALTIKKNKEIYGEFYGFDFNERQEVSTVKSDIFENEVDKIEKLK